MKMQLSHRESDDSYWAVVARLPETLRRTTKTLVVSGAIQLPQTEEVKSHLGQASHPMEVQS
ncbi:MAG: hypothetical protein AAF709_22855 [Pseudomonadota bacterium]